MEGKSVKESQDQLKVVLEKQKLKAEIPDVKEPKDAVKWDHDLIVSWYRLGVFMPFFRAHACMDTIRREPYLFSETTF